MSSMIDLRKAIAYQRREYLERNRPDENTLIRARIDALSSRLTAIDDVAGKSRWTYEHGARVVQHECEPWSVHAGAIHDYDSHRMALDKVKIDVSDDQGRNDWTSLVVILYLVTNIHPSDEPGEALFAPVWDMPDEPVVEWDAPGDDEVLAADEAQILEWALDRPDFNMDRSTDLMMARLREFGYTYEKIGEVFGRHKGTVGHRVRGLSV